MERAARHPPPPAALTPWCPPGPSEHTGGSARVAILPSTKIRGSKRRYTAERSPDTSPTPVGPLPAPCQTHTAPSTRARRGPTRAPTSSPLPCRLLLGCVHTPGSSRSRRKGNLGAGNPLNLCSSGGEAGFEEQIALSRSASRRAARRRRRALCGEGIRRANCFVSANTSTRAAEWVSCTMSTRGQCAAIQNSEKKIKKFNTTAKEARQKLSARLAGYARHKYCCRGTELWRCLRNTGSARASWQ